jgi:signal transduction histidine kinase
VYIEKISNSSKKMSALIKDMLSYARLSKSEMRFIPTDLNAVLQSVKDDLDIPIIQHQAIITANELPVIEALPSQMEQLLYNLINNSLKFRDATRKPEITIYSRALSSTDVIARGLNPHVTYYELRYSDNGIGFDNKYSERIFSLFQRLNTKDAYPGTGIGLSLCKKVVDNHKGLITASGEENAGAAFIITLPAEHK